MDILTGFSGAELIGLVSVITLGITGIAQAIDRRLK